MAVVERTFDIALTQEFTAYLQNLVNSQWNDETVVYPALAIKTIAPKPLEDAVRISTLYWDGMNYTGYKLPLSTNTVITLGMIEDETEENPPTLTGHLLLTGTYSAEPSIKTITFEILAVRNEDFTPEVS